MADAIKHLLFLSSDPISLPCLDRLAEYGKNEIERITVLTHPDRRTGRGRKVTRNPVAAYAENLGLPVLQVETFSAGDLKTWGSPECAVVFAYGRILKDSILRFFRSGCFNIHASPLPKLRGPSPLETAIALGWASTEINWMRMVLQMDAGAVGLRKFIPITETTTGPKLRASVAKESASVLSQALLASVRGEINWQEQNEKEATYCRKIQKVDGWLDFRQPAKQLEARIRAFEGWPGASFLWGEERIRVAEVRVVDARGEPGEVLSLKNGLTVAASENALVFGRLQRPGKNWQSATEFLRGTPIPLHTILASDFTIPLLHEK